MKRLILVFLVVILSLKLNAQDKASVEHTIFGVQTGVLGIWFNSEIKMTDDLALRAEIGFDTGIFGGDFYDNTNFLLYPTITLEPRYYYNLNKRLNKNRSISKNSGNFFTVKLNYVPDLFVISNTENVSVADNFSIIPKWGIKRTVANHLTYELGLGLGYRYYFLKQYGYSSNDGEVALDLHIRIGYTF